MNTFEMSRKFAKLNEAMIRTIGIDAVHDNEDIVIQDAISSNDEGLTFAGNQINETPPFSDWEETGEFHQNLSFAGKEDIEFTSRGDGAEAIFETFPTIDTIAPTAKILSGEAIKDIKVSFIKKVKAL
jgi:hypothetical protein